MIKNDSTPPSGSVEDRLCPISDTSAYRVEGYATDYLYSGELFPLLRNVASGLLITGSAPSSDSLAKYYQSDRYIAHNTASGGVLSSIYRLARAVFLPFKYRIVASAMPRKKAGGGCLIDVGCGVGHFAHYVAQRGHQVIGIEQSLKAREYVQTKWGLTCFSSFLGENAQAFLKPESVDAITLWHVLEHIDTIPQHFSQFRRLLKPQGVLLVAVPNHTSFDARRYRTKWAAYDVPRHLWHFSPQTMSALAKKEGFRIIKSYPLFLDAFYISLLSEQLQGAKPIKAVANALYYGSVSFFRTLRCRTEASSIAYLMQKDETL